MRILFSESDTDFLNSISSLMEKNNFTVDKVNNGEDCLAYAEFDIYDVIIIGADSTPGSGIEVIKKIRNRKNATPILFFAAGHEVNERITALDCGADACLCKPFAAAEMLALVRALSRRKPMQLQFGILSFCDITLDLNTNELICNNHIVHLGIKEFQIMKILIASGKNVVVKDALAEKVWGINSPTEYNNIEVYITFLRRKLKKLNSQVVINNVRGIGYILRSKQE